MTIESIPIQDMDDIKIVHAVFLQKEWILTK